jgi:flagellar biosynthetic protein FliR
MLTYASNDLVQWVIEFALPFFRIAAFFAVVPIFGNQLIPVMIRLVFALITAVVILPVLPDISATPIANENWLLSPAMIVVVMQQVLIGAALGFFVQIFFHIFILAGQMMAMQMGLGFASMVDPTNGVSVAVVSQFNVVLSTLLFLSFNAHLVLIEVLVESFTYLPFGQSLSDSALLFIARAGVWMFASAFLLALPAVAAILIVNIAFGVMTRSAPQLNIFSLGFPFTLVFGIFIIWVALAAFLPHYQSFSEQVFVYLRQIYL